MTAARTPDENPWLANAFSPQHESGYGMGVRLALRQEVVDGIALDAGFQSRIDMEEFAAYRGCLFPACRPRYPGARQGRARFPGQRPLLAQRGD